MADVSKQQTIKRPTKKVKADEVTADIKNVVDGITDDAIAVVQASVTKPVKIPRGKKAAPVAAAVSPVNSCSRFLSGSPGSAVPMAVNVSFVIL